MSASVQSPPKDLSVDVVGIPVPYWREGSGPPLLVLHSDTGRGDWNDFLAALAEEHEIIVPAMFGFPPCEVPKWMRSTTDVAAAMQQFVQALDLVGTPVVGLGFGAWVAAEMAVRRDGLFSEMVLVAPLGVKPREGEIFDRFLIAEERYIALGFADPGTFEELYGAEQEDEVRKKWDQAREMSSRIAWKPYYFNRSLPHLLSGASAPTLIIRGDKDAIVPVACAEQYAELLPNAELKSISGAGHRLELERPDELAGLVVEFVRARSGAGKVSA